LSLIWQWLAVVVVVDKTTLQVKVLVQVAVLEVC
jgi:hypothetical protein